MPLGRASTRLTSVSAIRSRVPHRAPSVVSSRAGAVSPVGHGRECLVRYAYTDVTDRADLVAPYPEVVATFEAVGWRPLGRYALELPDRVVERLVAGYPEPARSEFRAHLPDVTTTLVSPDGEVSAFVSWFWEEPAVRLASVLFDGTLVETSRLWTRRPPWPRAMRSGWAGMDLREEVERSSVPRHGRSVRAVLTGDLADVASLSALVDAHRAHVEEFRSARVPFASIGDVIAVRRKAFEHDLRVRNRAVAVLAALLLLSAVVLGWLTGASPLARNTTWLGLLLESAVLLVAITLAQGWLLRTLSYVRWIRPSYR
jgi:hypothetical protein